MDGAMDIASQLALLRDLHHSGDLGNDEYKEAKQAAIYGSRKRAFDQLGDAAWVGDDRGVTPECKPPSTMMLGKSLETMAKPILNKQTPGQKDAVKTTVVLNTSKRTKWDADAAGKIAVKALKQLFCEPGRHERVKHGSKFKIGISSLDQHGTMTRLQQMDYKWAAADQKRILVCGIGSKDPTNDYGFSDAVSRTIEDHLIDALHELVGKTAVLNLPTGARKGNKSQYRGLDSTVRYAYLAEQLA